MSECCSGSNLLTELKKNNSMEYDFERHVLLTREWVSGWGISNLSVSIASFPLLQVVYCYSANPPSATVPEAVKELRAGHESTTMAS